MIDANVAFTINNTDMPEDVQKTAIEVAQSALKQFTIQRDIAKHIKERFDEIYGSSWHCIVGRNFGSYVSHDEKSFVYMSVHDIHILLFRAG